MKRIPLLFLALCFLGYAPYVRADHQVKIEDPCQVGLVVAHVSIPATAPPHEQSAGSLTLAALEKSELPFKGTEEGIQSIVGTPESRDAIEFETDTVFRIHGWCYEIDGIQPALMPGDFKLEHDHHQIRWFFGYSRYRAGNWEGYCETDQVLSSFCQGKAP